MDIIWKKHIEPGGQDNKPLIAFQIQSSPCARHPGHLHPTSKWRCPFSCAAVVNSKTQNNTLQAGSCIAKTLFSTDSQLPLGHYSSGNPFTPANIGQQYNTNN